MHARMATILLGLARLDPFNADAQPEPPYRQLAQVKQGVSGSEGENAQLLQENKTARVRRLPAKSDGGGSV